jgi:hypothetical protein
VLRIAIHIERLLLANDCVVIPEVGGFVLHPCPAVYQPEVHRFSPPHKEIVFNPTLIHQDGLLPESYIQMYGMTFSQAQTALKKDIAALRTQIDKAGEFYIEKIGYLKKGEDGRILFAPDLDSSFLGLKPYGLYPFHLPPVPQYEHKETPVIAMKQAGSQSDNVVYVPVKRAFIRAVGIAVAAACLILFVSIPLKEIDPTSYSASMIPCEITSTSANVSETQIDTTHMSEIEIEVKAENTVSNEITQPVVAETLPVVKVGTPPVVKTETPFEVKAETPAVVKAETLPVVQTETLPVSNTDMQSQKVYYAIIGSFVTEKQANQYIQDIKMPELTNLGIVINDGRVRVFAGQFDERKEAESYINRLRANAKLKDTWLYVGR